LYLFGRGGTSKSYTVERTLKELGRAYEVSNSRITGRGLFDLQRDSPDKVHVIDDAEPLLHDPNAQGVLRSALGGQPDEHGLPERPVAWTKAQSPAKFWFRGGIIIINNSPLENIPPLEALRTRIAYIHHEVSNEEVAALMRSLAKCGFPYGPQLRLTPAECLEVVEVVIGCTQRLRGNLHIRHYMSGCLDRLQWSQGASVYHWQELIQSRLTESQPRRVGLSRAQRKARELDLIRKIEELPVPQRLEAWIAETGKSQSALYRRIQDLGRNSHFSQ
jgi:hypothetical protein